jgi:hypothetical protein
MVDALHGNSQCSNDEIKCGSELARDDDVLVENSSPDTLLSRASSIPQVIRLNKNAHKKSGNRVNGCHFFARRDYWP